MELLAFFGLVTLAAASGAIFKPDEWYERLRKPSWNPPNWAFPVVWTILYAMMAVAGWLVWREVGWSTAIVIWGAQLVLNAAWSWLFFGEKRMDLAFAEVMLLLAAILAFIVAAWPVSMWASLLFVPYLAWVGTAAALNWTVWKMNPEMNGPEERKA